MTDIIRAIQKKEVFLTGKDNIVRDYIGDADLFSLVRCCIEKGRNRAYDVFSLKPVKKIEVLKAFTKKFGLRYQFTAKNISLSSTGVKKFYFSNDKKAKELGYHPKFGSLELLINETENILSKKGGL